MKTTLFMACMYFLWPEVKSDYHNSSSFATSSFSFQKSNKKAFADSTSLNGQWFLQPVFVADTATGKIPVLHINLAAGTFSGNTGCNNMNGSFEKTDSSLVFDKNIVTTKMSCAGYDEAAFIKSLISANRYKFDNGILVLMFDATELSRWTRKPQKKIKMNKA